MVGAKPMMRPITPMALPRRSRGNTSRITLDTMGSTAPVAAACITRPAMSTGKLGATRAIKLPAPKSDRPPR